MTSQKEDSERDNLKRMIDALPGSELYAARRYLQFLHYHGDSLAWMLDNAPVDDEPVTDEDWIAIREADEEIAAG